jgi:hypothetical protein
MELSFTEMFSDKAIIFFIANSLYVISYMVTSILWLRIIAVIASISTFPYFYFQPEPLWLAIFWQSAFFLVNFLNLVLLWYSMRKRKFNEIEEEVHAKYFSDLKDYEVAPVFKHAEILHPQNGSTLLKKGQVNDSLLLLVKGDCDVILPNSTIVKLVPGKFVGEMSFLSGDPVSADIVVNENSVFYVWEKENLKQLFSKHALYKPYIYSLCSMDMAEKLRQMSKPVTPV